MAPSVSRYYIPNLRAPPMRRGKRTGCAVYRFALILVAAALRLGVSPFQLAWRRRPPLTYYISRRSEQYGPYSMAQLERYVGEGRIARTDFARTEDSEEWVPVQQLLGGLG